MRLVRSLNKLKDEIKFHNIVCKKENDEIKINGEIIEQKNVPEMGVMIDKEYSFKNPLTREIKNYLFSISSVEGFLHRIEIKSKKSYKFSFDYLSGKMVNIFSNIIIIIYKDYNVDFFIPFKSFLYFESMKIENYLGIYLPDLVHKMMHSHKNKKRECEILSRPISLILVKCKDGIVKTDLSLLQSEYINNLVDNLKDDEYIEEFSDLTLSEFERLFTPVWRANEAKIVSKLHKIDSSFFSLRAKNLYYNLRGYSGIDFLNMLYLFV